MSKQPTLSDDQLRKLWRLALALARTAERALQIASDASLSEARHFVPVIMEMSDVARSDANKARMQRKAAKRAARKSARAIITDPYT